jgi:carboxyl-terminal processing protease
MQSFKYGNPIRLLATALLLVAVGNPALAEKPAKPVESKKAEEPQTLPVNELRAFAEVFDRIKKDYVKKVDDKELIEYAIRGMLEGLDPHSSYLNQEEYQELSVDTRGEFGGLGIEVGMEDGFVKVISPIDDTPAAEAGIKPGDLIIRLDGKTVKGMTLNDAVDVMRGKPGSKIVLTIVREGLSKPKEITVVRAVIKIKSVKSRMLEPGFGYVRLTTFQTKTTLELRKAVKALQKEAGGRLKGMVLDLRNNPGGVLPTAASVSDAFLHEGLIVYTEGRLRDAKQSFHSKPGDILDGAPLVVLVNDGSASASEIVAGALQDRKRAVVIGQQTFGKGSVQTVIPVGAHGALKLTTARYYTPLGRSIQAEGIVPDIIVEEVKVSREKEKNGLRVKEADLARHLNNSKAEGDDVNKPSPKEESEKSKEPQEYLLEKDFALNEALNLLKGLSILGGREDEAKNEKGAKAK